MGGSVEDLYNAYGPLVFRRCLAVLKDEEEAWDCLQEVFLKLMDAPGRLDGVERPASFLHKMATNASLDRLRRNRGRRPAFVAVEDFPDEREEAREGGLAAALLLELLSSGLGSRTRAIVYHRYVDGMGLDEIAGHLALSLSSVRQHLDRFKARARRHKERIL